MLNIEKIYQAKERIKDVVVNTPFSHAPYLSEISGCEVYLKKENLQVTGAFKIRGAYNKLASLNDEQLACGVVAASAGNHAQGVALSASKFGVKAVIIMPESTPLTKVNGVKHFGAEVILAGANYDEAYAYAKEYGEKNSLTFVHPFEDEDVIAGQGTVALDILEKCEDLDAVDTLVNMYKRIEYRRDDIEKALQKVSAATINLQGDDGGFLWAKRHHFGIKDWSKLGFSILRHCNFGYWRHSCTEAVIGQFITYNKPRLSQGWTKTGIPATESDIFATWFRSLNLALISQVLPENPYAEIDWKFLKSPGLGYFKK